MERPFMMTKYPFDLKSSNFDFQIYMGYES